MDIPTPLTISVERQPKAGISNPTVGHPGFKYVVTCAEYPALRVQHTEPYIAIVDLLEDVQNAERRRNVVDDDGHPFCETSDEEWRGSNDVDEVDFPWGETDEGRWAPDYITAWNDLVRAANGEWDYRIESDDLEAGLMHDPELREQWARTGIPSETARKFRALLLEPDDARRLHAGSRTPEETLPYVVEAESTGWWNWPDFNVVEWVVVGIKVDRVRLYRAAGYSAADAATWEVVAATYTLSTDDIRAVFRAGFTPASVAAGADAWADEGHSVGDAARTCIAEMGLDPGTAQDRF